MGEQRENRFEDHFDPAEVAILQGALVFYKAKLEGENYSMLVARLLAEAGAAPSLDQEYVPGGRQDLEAVLRNLGTGDSEIEETRNWPLASVEDLIQEKLEDEPR
jgi:hypothetical protein